MKLRYLALALFCISAVTALEELTITQGDTLLLVTDTHVRNPSSISADYEIPALHFAYYTKDTNPTSSSIEQPIGLAAPPGQYIMTVTLTVNEQFLRQDKFIIRVIADRETQEQQQNTTREQTPVVAPKKVVIDPIPDVTPGTTLVIPLRITGNGTYELRIPPLSFATYEVPRPITVNGTGTTSVLLHIRSDAKPGTYSIPINASGEVTTAQVRVIKYVQPAKGYSWLIPLGVGIFIIGVLLIFLLRMNKKRPQPPKRDDDTEKSDLITYY
jgi:hypothetical protein